MLEIRVVKNESVFSSLMCEGVFHSIKSGRYSVRCSCSGKSIGSTSIPLGPNCEAINVQYVQHLDANVGLYPPPPNKIVGLSNCKTRSTHFPMVWMSRFQLHFIVSPASPSQPHCITMASGWYME